MAFDPNDNTVPMNIYITRQMKAILKAEAARLDCTMMAVIRWGLEKIVQRRAAAKQPMPRPVPVHRAKWREKARKKRKGAKTASKTKAKVKTKTKPKLKVVTPVEQAA